MINTGSVLPFPGLNPNCMLLTVISFLRLRSRIFSNIFIPCSNNLMSLKFPHSSESPFCLYMGTITLFFHSSGICSSSQTLFSISCIMSSPLSTKCLIRHLLAPHTDNIQNRLSHQIIFSATQHGESRLNEIVCHMGDPVVAIF